MRHTRVSTIAAASTAGAVLLAALAGPAEALMLRGYRVRDSESGYVRSSVTVCTKHRASVTLVADFLVHGSRPLLRSDSSWPETQHAGCQRHVLTTWKRSRGIYAGIWDTQLTVSTSSDTKRTRILTLTVYTPVN